MRELIATLCRFAATQAPVLIEGETGSGKELAARAIHVNSAVAAGPWVDINCAALPDHLAESELFGYEKGAFSGADTTKPGLFELADGGTLFFDEIGELPPQLQGKLLRVLDHMEYYRLGGTRKVRVRARVVAATNRSLAAEVKRSQFRADLYHRLSAVVLEVPPLRERREDIGVLAGRFLAQVAVGKHIDASAVWLLERYDWPGNVRQLRNVVQRAAALSLGNTLGPGELPAEIQSLGPVPAAPDRGVSAGMVAAPLDSRKLPADWCLEAMERRWIEAALEHTGGHQQRAANLLGVSRRTLSRKLRDWGTQSASEGLAG